MVTNVLTRQESAYYVASTPTPSVETRESSRDSSLTVSIHYDATTRLTEPQQPLMTVNPGGTTTTTTRGSRTVSALWDRGELQYSQDSRGGRRPYWSGQSWHLGAARFWEELARDMGVPDDYRLGVDLRDELLACVIGGHGVRWSVVSPYIDRIRAAGVLARPTVSADELRELLTAPVRVNGRWQRYRFPNQRAQRLSSVLNTVGTDHYEELDDIRLRDKLTSIHGIGRKTASWVVRNYRASDQVAIIDIHIARAGTVAGVFNPDWDISRNYLDYEAAFLSWSRNAGVSAAALDAVIWGHLAGDEAWSKDVLGVSSYMDTSLKPVWPHDGQTDT